MGNVLEQTNISFLRNTSKKKIQIENNKDYSVQERKIKNIIKSLEIKAQK
jgi:hypothetical protein